MIMNPSEHWSFAYASIQEAAEDLHYYPGKRNVRGEFLIEEDDLICIVYTSRWSVLEYREILAGRPVLNMGPDSSELKLYKYSNEYPDRLEQRVPSNQTRLLISCFPVNGSCLNDLIFIPLLRKPEGERHLCYTDEDRDAIRSKVIGLVADNRPALVLVSRVESS